MRRGIKLYIDIKDLKKKQNQINEEREEARILAVRSLLLPKPKGLLIMRCPKDNKKLEERRYYNNFNPGLSMVEVITVYYCECGYRYATVR
jgi:hypothetical protein